MQVQRKGGKGLEGLGNVITYLWQSYPTEYNMSHRVIINYLVATFYKVKNR